VRQHDICAFYFAAPLYKHRGGSLGINICSDSYKLFCIWERNIWKTNAILLPNAQIKIALKKECDIF